MSIGLRGDVCDLSDELPVNFRANENDDFGVPLAQLPLVSPDNGDANGSFCSRQPHNWSAWSHDELLLLRQLHRDGVPLIDQSEKIGRSYSAIKAKRRKLGLVRARGRRCKLFTRQMDQIITTMKQCGSTNRAVGKVVGRTTSQVYQRCLSLGIIGAGDSASRRVSKSVSVENSRAEKSPAKKSTGKLSSKLSRFDIRRFEGKRRQCWS